MADFQIDEIEAQQVNMRHTDDIDSQRISVDIRPQIQTLQMERAPLSLISRMSNSEGTEKPRFEHLEGGLRKLTIEADGDSTGSGTVTVDLLEDHADNIRTDEVLHNNRNSERYRITDVDRDNDTIDVVRVGDDAGDSVGIEDADTLILIGSAHEEGSGAPAEVNAALYKDYNYTQIFKDSFSVTGTLASTILDQGNPEFDRLSKQKALEHIRSIELAFTFGTRDKVAGPEGEPRRFTGGLDEFIQTNRFDLGDNALTMSTLDEYAEQFMQWGSERKFLLAGSNFIRSIHSFARDHLKIEQDESTFGVRVERLVTGFGELDIVYHKLLSQNGYNDVAFVIDEEAIGRRYLSNNDQDRDNTLQMNIQKRDEDKVKAQYLSEVGLEVINEQKLAKLENCGTP